MNRLAIAVSVAILDNVSGLRPVAQAVSLQRARHLVQLGTAKLKKNFLASLDLFSTPHVPRNVTPHSETTNNHPIQIKSKRRLSTIF